MSIISLSLRRLMIGKTEVERRLRMRIPHALWREAELEGLVGALEAAADDE